MTLPVTPAHLSPADEAALAELYRRGTPPNTIRAWERDLAYISAWKLAAFGAPLAWSEAEGVALRFILDHSVDLRTMPGPAWDVAQALIEEGLRRALACPAPATLYRRIASWRASHRMRNLPSPFEAPLIAQARSRARRAAARPAAPKSARPITRPVLEAMLATCDGSYRGLRDRAALMLGWASGGRRRSEIVALNRDDLDLGEWEAKGPHPAAAARHQDHRAGPGPAPAAEGAAGARGAGLAGTGPDRGRSPLPPDQPVRPRPAPPPYARGPARHRPAPLGAGRLPCGLCQRPRAAGRLPDPGRPGRRAAAGGHTALAPPLHRSAPQAQRYYADVEIAENPAADLLS